MCIRFINKGGKIDVNKQKIKFGYSDFITFDDTNFNFSNVTNMLRMFSDCSKLQTIPLLDTSNVTTMQAMFSGCTNLRTIPLIDTSNVTNMETMFFGCPTLSSIPLINTNKVGKMKNMFSDCSNLQTVPLLDTSNVTTMQAMFRSCTNLTNESLNNILAMCINSAITSNKTLKYIGLSSTQATTCTTLSNYQDFLDAGWTTGY